MSFIYQPKGKAREFAELACNLYKGCAHGCVYCYAPQTTYKKRDTFTSDEYIKPRPGILEALKKDAPNYSGGSTPILLCFTTDAYQPMERQQLITRQALEILAANNCPVTILTKGGSWGLIRDLDLLKSNPLNEWGVTLTHDDPQVSQLWEPGAALPQDRIKSLRIAHEAGIKTWVSFEPVYDPEATYRLLYQTYKFVDYYRVGKINYHRIQQSIDWAEFLKNIQAQLDALRKTYYLKSDLRRYAMKKRKVCRKKKSESSEPGKVAGGNTVTSQGDGKMKGSEPPPIKIISAGEILSTQTPPTPFFFPNLLPQGLTILAGKPKLGKSRFCLNLACSIAYRFEFLGQTPEVHKVLYLALEDHEARVKKRLTQVLPENFKVQSEKLQFAYQCPRMDRGGLQALAKTLEADPEIKVVILDTLVKVRGEKRRGSSQYDKDYNEIAKLKELADRFGIAMVVVHHLIKTKAKDPFDMVTGSNGLTGAADNILLLTSDRSGANAILKIHSREIEDQDRAIGFDKSTNWWTLLGKPAEEYQISQERQEILDFLKEEAEEPVTLHGIATFLGKKKPNVYNLLKKLVKQGLVEKVGFGKYQLKPVEEKTVGTQCAGPKPSGTSCLKLVPKIDGAKVEGKKGEKINFRQKKRKKAEKTEAHKKVEAMQDSSNDAIGLWS